MYIMYTYIPIFLLYIVYNININIIIYHNIYHIWNGPIIGTILWNHKKLFAGSLAPGMFGPPTSILVFVFLYFLWYLAAAMGPPSPPNIIYIYIYIYIWIWICIYLYLYSYNYTFDLYTYLFILSRYVVGHTAY